MLKRSMVGAWGVLLVTIAPVWAHAFPCRSQPRVGAILTSVPEQVSIWFDGALQPGLDILKVTKDGKPVTQGLGTVDPKDHTLLQVPMTPAGTGTYHVAWRVMAVDGHVTHGRFHFQVK